MSNLLNLFLLYNYILWPVIIFFSRILDVSVGTIRLIMINKGLKWFAALLGFFEVFLWILIISQLLKNINNFTCYIAYAAGFATGNYIGMILEEKIAIGYCVFRVICQSSSYKSLLLELIENGFGVTIIKAEGSTGPVNIIYSVVKRKDIKKVTSIIENISPNSFYTIEDVRIAKKGIFPNK